MMRYKRRELEYWLVLVMVLDKYMLVDRYMLHFYRNFRNRLVHRHIDYLLYTIGYTMPGLVSVNWLECWLVRL